ncbi:MAG: hypothetical protein OXE04_09280 [bacterium]|nr:hypothetical protein [bacterium]
MNPRTWIGQQSDQSTSIPPNTEARIQAQEAELDRQITNGTFGADAATAEELELKLLG